MARFLLDRGADVDIRTCSGETALHAAAHAGHEAIILLLLDNGANATAKDCFGRIALYLAANSGHVAAVRQLLDKESAIDAQVDLYG